GPGQWAAAFYRRPGKIPAAFVSIGIFMKLLVIGCKGQLGSDMVVLARKAGHEVVCTDTPDIDIADAHSVKAALMRCDPEGVVNCAAYTNVDGCETNRELAFAVNAAGAGNVAAAADAVGALTMHISTDFVFDGLLGRSLTESDTPNPQSVYGKSKLEGERLVLANTRRAQIFRIAWLYGLHGNNFVKNIRAIAQKKSGSGEVLKVVDDQFGTPTFTREVCRQILAMLSVGEYGVFHGTAEGYCSKFDFARHIIKKAGIPLEIVPCTTDEFPMPARRPVFGVLENSRLKALGKNVMVDWKAAFEEFLEAEKKI
ncbi:MAG: dTDP-4-dehydrorhamnose reductase, partial [Chitinivibrionales bacterium]|nr:dTDP-4-dehydrorhamnose reductase [Chitinivibrionales bacterium]